MSATFYELLKYAKTGIASPEMTHYDKLKALAMCKGGFPVATLTGIPPLSFRSDGTPLTAWSISGNMVQTGTPTPSAPIQPEQTGDKTANLAPTATYTNSSTDTKTFFRPWIQLRKNNTNVATKAFSDIDSSGTYSFSFTVSEDIDEVRLIHNGSVRNLYPVDVFGDFQYGDYVLSATITGANPSEVGGLALEKIMLNTGITALPFEPFGFKITLNL